MSKQNKKTNGDENMKYFALITLLCSLLLAACTGQKPSEEVFELKNSVWVLKQINGKPALESPIATLVFDESSLGGNGSCNSFGGDYKQDGANLTIGPLFSTLMACLEEGIMEQESDYLAALQAANRFRMEAGQLLLLDKSGAVLLVFDAQDSSLEGKNWLLTAYAVQNGITTPLPDTQITAQFADGKINGSSGCNTYFAEYTLNGSQVTFGPAGATKMFCMEPEGLMQQENDFLQAFSQVTRYRVEGRLLNFYNAEGQTVLQFLQAE
jgi:heat shock protein HslJ